MEADAFDEYLRTRHNLLKSVVDGLDYDNAVADHFFSSLNLHRQGEDDFVKSWEDNVCDMILRGEWTQGMSDIITKNVDKLSSLNRQSEIMHDLDHPWRGRIRDLPSALDMFSEEIELGPPGPDGYYPVHHPHDNMHHAMKRMNSVTGRPYWVEALRSFYLPSTPGGMSQSQLHEIVERAQDKYDKAERNPIVIGTGFKPSKNELKEIKDEFSAMLSERDESGEPSQNALRLQFEIQGIMDKDKNINQAQALDQLVNTEATERNISSSDTRHSHLGPHNDVHSHTLYIRDFERWKAENQELVSEIKSSLPPPRDEFELQKRHFEARADDWLSDDAHDEPYTVNTDGEESDDIYANPETWGEDKPASVSYQLRKRLNYNGYRHGMEWLTPLERAKVADHLHQHGTGKGDKQMIDLGDGFKTSIGRINRDYAQRVAHEIHHYMRGQNFHGPNLNNHVEGTHDHPQAEKAADETAYLDALKDVKHSSGSSMYDFILGELNNNLGIEQLSEQTFQTAMDDWTADRMEDLDYENNPPPIADDYRVKELPHIPNIKRGFKTKVQRRMEREGVSYQQALMEELRESHNVIDSETNEVSEGPHKLTRSKLLDLVGLNEELGAKDPTELYHSDEPMITADEMMLIDEMAKEKGDKARLHKLIRGSHRRHSTGFNGPRKEDLPERERNLFIENKETGELMGLGFPFATEFQINGGHGRSISSLIHFLHSPLPKMGEDEESIIGTELEDSLQFTVNPMTEGLYGMFSALVHDKILPRDVRPGEIISGFDVSTPRGFREGKATRPPLNPKNNYTDHATSFAAPSAMDVKGKGEEERKEMFQGNSNKFANLISSATGLGSNPKSTSSARTVLPKSNQKSRVARRHATIFGRMRPPHDPQEAMRLTMAQLRTGRHPFGHIVDAPRDFFGYQGRVKPDEGEDLVDFSEKTMFGGFDAPMGETNYDDLHLHLEETVSLKQELEERLEEQKQTGEVDKKIVDQISDAEEEIDSVTNLLLEAEKQTYSDEPVHQMSLENKENMDTKDDQDNIAHIEMARRLIDMIPSEQVPNPQENPAAFWALTSRALRDAGRMLRILPPQEGITTHSYRHTKGQALTSSQLSDDGVFDPHQLLGNTVKQLGQEVLPSSDVEDVLESLGLPNDAPHVNMIERLIESIDRPVRVMKNADILNSSVATGVEFHPPDMRIRDENRELIRPDYSLHGGQYVDDHHGALKEFTGGQKGRIKDRAKELQSRFELPLRYITQKLMREKSGAVERNNLSHIPLSPIDMQQRNMTVFGNGKRGTSANPNIKGVKNRIKSLMHDLIVSHGDLEEGQVSQGQEILSAGWGSVPVGPATSSRYHTVQDLYGASSAMDFGYEGQSPFGWEYENGKPVIGTFTQPETYHSIPNETMRAIWQDPRFSNLAESYISSDWQPTSTVNNQNRVNEMGQTAHQDAMLKTDDLAIMLNPDLLLKEDEARPPPLLPMHRLFSLKDLEAFRGFTGDWVVSAYPEGKRLIITRDGDSISAYDSNAEDVSVSGTSQQHLKKLTEKDFVVDAIKRGKSLYIFDILSYDGTNISDLSVPERLKVLRGQFDSYETAHIPAPDDTVVTDEGGLEGAVERLKEEHPRLLLRDGKSTYMKGERRHPKWFMLRKNKDIALIILDVRGKGPFTYRLGAGPVDEDDLGNRGVEHEGATYLDVGTVKSPKPFEEGDIVRVSVSGVKAKRRGEKTIYDVTPNTIRAASDVESPASLESLGLLAKSHPIIPVKYDLSIVDDVLTVSFDGIDDVLYKMEKTRNGYWAHSPKGALSPLMNTDYPILLAESMRPIWHDVASVLISKKLERLDLDVLEHRAKKPEAGKVRSMTNPKHREASEKESAGVIEEDDDDNILKPEKQKKMLDMLSRITDLTERIKKEKMTGRVSAQGLGIDVGAQIESPRGPTELRSEQSMPDWDMLERPTEDPENEYPQARKKRRMLEQSGENQIEMRED